MKPIEAVLRAPWLITPEGGELVLGVYERWLTTPRPERIAAAVEARGGVPFEGNDRDTELVGDVAIVAIDGPLVRKAELLDDLSSGATSYAWIGAQCRMIAEAASAGTVKNAILRFNTPGGEAAGCGVCSDEIRSLAELLESKGGELVGYIETQASSGGLYLVTQCSRVVAHVASRTGSLGVRFMLTDTSAAEKKLGITRHEVISHGSEGKRATPVDAEVLDRVQVLADDIFGVFVDAVASGRNVTPAEAIARFGGGDELIAEKALAAGIVDELGDLDSILAQLSAHSSSAPDLRAPRGTMKNPSETPITTAASPRAEGAAPAAPMRCAGCNADMTGQASYCATCFDEDDDKEDGDDEDAKALAAAGLLGKTRGETRANLTAFARTSLKASGAATADQALGLIKAGAEARAELEAARATAIAAAAAKAKAGVLAGLAAAVQSGRLTLGALVAADGPLVFVADAEAAKVQAAVKGVEARFAVKLQPGETRPSLLEALVGAFGEATYTAREASQIGVYLSAKGVALPAAHREAPPLPGQFAKVNEQTAAAAAALGIDPAVVVEHAQMRPADLSLEAMAKLAKENSTK
jgi:ClpP class serine protease